MKIFTELLSILAGVLFLQFIVVECTTKETLNVKVFNPKYQVPEERLLKLLREANLESHGYKKEVVDKMVSEPGSGKKGTEKSFLFYQIVECSRARLREIDQELKNLLPGVFNNEMVKKINKEIDAKGLTKMKQCKVGLEIHFKQQCFDKKKTVRRRKRRCGICLFCWSAAFSD
ncbi:uncharacterized protein LOC111343362 [Stylophora pistillata]|uniref:uncharacterized protein LOC111343362 n=1 Tax=Stylophora pistillata TaxID=50429 RepID=UPI000C0438BD|nr:uncharacterized protein LOC111343362 [Stylophora pistillata]